MADGSITLDTKIDETGLKTGLAKLGSSTLKGVTTAIAAAGTALVGFGASAVKTGMDFDTSMSQIAATMGMTVDDIKGNVNGAGDTFEALRNKALEMGSITNFSASQAAEGLNILAMAGYSADESMEMIEDVLHLSAAGAMDMGTAAGFVAGAMKGFGDETKTAGYYADLIAKGATLANTDVTALGEAFSDSASSARAYGQEADATALSLLRLAEQNITGSEASTAYAAIMRELFTPTTDAAKNALEELGVAAYDESGKARDLNDVVDDLAGALAGMTDEQAAAYKQTIFGRQGLDAFNKMTITATDKQEEWAEALAHASDGMGEAAKQYATQTDNLKGDLDILSSAFSDLQIRVNDEVTPALRSFTQEGTELLGELSRAVQEGGLSGLAGAVGSVLAEAVTYLSDYIPQFVQGGVQLIKGLVQGLIDSAPVLAEAAVQAGMALLEGILSITTQLVVLGGELIIALCNGIAANAPQIMQTAMEGLLQFTEAVVTYLPLVIQAGIEMIGALAQGLLEAIPTLLAALPTIVQSLVDGILATLDTLIQTAVSLVEGIVAAMPQIISALIAALPQIVTSICEGILALIDMVVTAGVQLLTALVQALPEIIVTICQALPQIITEIVGTLLGMIPQIIDCGVQLLVSLVQALPDIIYAIVLVLPQIIAAIISTLVGMIPQIIQCGVQLLVSLVSALPQIIIAIVAVLPQIISSIIQALLANIPLLIQCGVQLLTSLIGALPQIITTIVMALPQIISSIIQALLSNIPLIVQSGIQLFVALIQALPQIISTIVQAIPQIGRSIVSAITGLIPSMVTAGFNLLRGLATGIGNAVSSVVQSAAAACRSVFDRVKSFFGIASPSKLFRDVIGKNLMLGLAGGVEDETDTAVAAVQDAADEISDIDFGVDYDSLVSSGKGSIQAMASAAGTAVTAAAASKAYDTSLDSEDGAAGESSNPKYIVNNINVDGRRAARIITPYIAEELEWSDE